MAKVASMEYKLQAKRSKEELERWKAFFLQQFGDQPKEVLADLFKAIQDKDQAAYMAIAEPIIRRNAMKEYNREGSSI